MSWQVKIVFLRSEGSCSAGCDKSLERELELFFLRRDLPPSIFNLYSDILNTRLLWFLFCFRFTYTFLSLWIFHVCDSICSTWMGLWFSYHLLVLCLSPAIPGVLESCYNTYISAGFLIFFTCCLRVTLCFSSFLLCNILSQFGTF